MPVSHPPGTFVLGSLTRTAPASCVRVRSPAFEPDQLARIYPM